MYNDTWHMWGMHGFWWIFWVILIFAMIWFFMNNARRDRRRFMKKGPLDVLKERYAKGEISEEEYHRMKKELEE